MNTTDLKKLVGSLLVVGFDGTRVTDSLRNFLEQWNLGGVILFKRNIESLEQVAVLNQSIYDAAAVTPIVSVDHEGGKVFRLPEPFTVFPPMKAVGNYCAAQGEPDMGLEIGKIFAKELRAAGFNLDYAPVLDVDSNPKNPIIGDRAFSCDPEAAAQIALAFWQGLQSEGVLGCGKHFPGHGDTLQDSHLTLPVVDKSFEALAACEFIPFQRAIRRGIPMLMTAHVRYPALDPVWPATLSQSILGGLLRKQLGFEGLIISDDFFMKGIAAHWGLEEATERFLQAGGDLVLLCHHEPQQRRVAAHLVHCAERDGEFLALLQAKAARMERFRAMLKTGRDSSKLAVVGSAEHRKRADSLV